MKIGVIGAGSWGTALANLLNMKGYAVDLWVFEKNVKDHILNLRENRTFLPGVKLSDNLNPSNDIVRVALQPFVKITLLIEVAKTFSTFLFRGPEALWEIRPSEIRCCGFFWRFS